MLTWWQGPPARPAVRALCPGTCALVACELTCASSTELKKQVESAELKNQRLKEVFQTKVQEFRKVCYTLTGYQVDITRESQYRLTSMYAEHQDDCLIFKVGPPARGRGRCRGVGLAASPWAGGDSPPSAPTLPSLWAPAHCRVCKLKPVTLAFGRKKEPLLLLGQPRGDGKRHSNLSPGSRVKARL